MRDLILSTIAGCMVFTSFPRYDLYPLMWFAFIPFFPVLQGRTTGSAFRWGAWTGLVINLGGFHWITGMLMDFGHFDFWLAFLICSVLCAYQGLVVAFWAAGVRWFQQRSSPSLLWLAPLVWILVEYLLPFVFPWYLANGQYLFYPAIQMVEVTGVLGLSFLIMLVNAGLYLGITQWWKKRTLGALKPALFVLFLFCLNVAYGLMRMHQVDTQMTQVPSLRIGLGEADVGIFEKEAKHLTTAREQVDMVRGNILKHNYLAALLEKEHKVDLIVEPESSFMPARRVRFKRNNLFALAAGPQGAVVAHRERADGGAWIGPTPVARKSGTIHDLSAAREDVLFAVGDQGLILRYDGRAESQWHREQLESPVNLRGVWAGATNVNERNLDDAPYEAWVVGDAGFAARRDDRGRWQTSKTTTNQNLHAVTGAGSEWVLAVGDAGTALRWDGTQWHRDQTPTKDTLRDVAAGPDGVAIAVGDAGTTLLRQRSAWTSHPSPVARTLHAVAIFGEQIIAGGDGGTLLDWESKKRRWRPMPTPTQSAILDLTMDGRERWYALQNNGALLTRSPTAPGWTVDETYRPQPGFQAIQGLGFSAARTYAHDTAFVYRSSVPLPAVADRMAAVANIQPALNADQSPKPPHWNGPVPTDHWNVPIRGFDTPILLGLLTYEPGEEKNGIAADRMYNSAMLLDSDGRRMGQYDKNYLLAFGEYIPLGDSFPVFYEWIPQANHFQAGRTTETFAFKGFTLGIMICYEDILPSFGRDLAGKNPNVFINVTNDAWFGKTSEPYLHLALSVFRSVEHRRWLIRSTNTGVSCFVDAVGRIRSETSLDDPEVLVADVPMMTGTTIYGQFGEVFAVFCFLCLLILLIRAIVAGKPATPARR